MYMYILKNNIDKNKRVSINIIGFISISLNVHILSL